MRARGGGGPCQLQRRWCGGAAWALEAHAAIMCDSRCSPPHNITSPQWRFRTPWLGVQPGQQAGCRMPQTEFTEFTGRLLASCTSSNAGWWCAARLPRPIMCAGAAGCRGRLPAMAFHSQLRALVKAIRIK